MRRDGGLLAVGVEIGHRPRAAAIAVVELESRREAADEQNGTELRHYVVRFLECLPPETRFPDLARRVGQISHQVGLHGHAPGVFINATGHGAPIVDLFREWVPQDSLREIYFNHGDRRVVGGDRQHIALGKGYLVAKLQGLLQAHRLHLPSTETAKRLAEELRDFELPIHPDANERHGAFRVGAQDDLVTAVGLAVQAEPRVSVYGTAYYSW